MTEEPAEPLESDVGPPGETHPVEHRAGGPAVEIVEESVLESDVAPAEEVEIVVDTVSPDEAEQIEEAEAVEEAEPDEGEAVTEVAEVDSIPASEVFEILDEPAPPAAVAPAGKGEGAAPVFALRDQAPAAAAGRTSTITEFMEIRIPHADAEGGLRQAEQAGAESGVEPLEELQPLPEILPLPPEPTEEGLEYFPRPRRKLRCGAEARGEA